MTDGAAAPGFEASALADQPAFHVVCVPIGNYREHPQLDADGEAAKVTKLLATLGGRAEPWKLSPTQARDTAVVNQRLRTWSKPPQARNSVLFWIGHGQADPTGAWLAVAETPRAMHEGGFLPENMAGFVETEWRRRSGGDGAWAIVVIEACGAKRFAHLLHSVLLRGDPPPSRFAVIGVGAPDGAGNLGEFRHALESVLSTYTDNDDAIKLTNLVGQLKARLPSGIGHDVELHLAAPILRPRRMTPLAAPMDVYAELQEFVAGLSVDERSHFLPKAQGADQFEQGEPAWYFVGREKERASIAGWMRSHEGGMLVVTGPAGSGKSALLGHVLVHATPPLRNLLIRTGQLRPAPSGEFDDRVRFDVVIHLTGMTSTELVRRLAAAAQIVEPSAGISGPDVDWLLDALTVRDRSFTVLVDALDESQEPAAIAGSVLRRLARLPRTRLLIGTRGSTREGPDLPEPGEADLLEALGRSATTCTIERDPQAVGRYVTLRLTAARTRGGLDMDNAAITEAAYLIQNQDRQFLYARLAVHEIIADPDLLTPVRRTDLVDMLSRDHRALFAATVDRLTRQRPAARPLLEALALARGRGLPRVDRVLGYHGHRSEGRHAGYRTRHRPPAARGRALCDARRRTRSERLPPRPPHVR